MDTVMKVTIGDREFDFSDPNSLDAFVGDLEDEHFDPSDPESNLPSELEMLLTNQMEFPQGIHEMIHILQDYRMVKSDLMGHELKSQASGGPYYLFFHEQQALAKTCAEKMDQFRERFEFLGVYLGYMWGTLVAMTSVLVEYDLEQFVQMDLNKRMDYFRTLSSEQQKYLNAEIAEWRDNTDQKEAEKKVLQWCKETQLEYGFSSEYSARIVGLAIQYRQLKSLEWLEIKPDD